MKLDNWKYWTFGIGLIPLLLRVLISAFFDFAIKTYDVTDIVFFGYVLNITILYEASQFYSKVIDAEDRKTINTILFWNIIGLTLFTSLFVISLYNEYSIDSHKFYFVNELLLVQVAFIIIIPFAVQSIGFFRTMDKILANS